MTVRDPYEAAGEEVVLREQAQANAERRRKQEIEDFKWLLAHKQGRRIAWRLLSKAGVFRTSMTGNSQTFFNEGRRDMGLWVLAEINEVSPDSYVQMLKEAQADE